MSSDTASRPASKVSFLEIIFLLVIAGGGLSLLLPALASSRETARSNVCRLNLRRLDSACEDYVMSQRKLPSVAWPVELLPRLNSLAGNHQLKMSGEMLTGDRPVVLTCPSHLYIRDEPSRFHSPHYVLIADRTQRKPANQLSWRFRDRSIDDPDQPNTHWFVGLQLTPEGAERQRVSQRGPHAGDRFNESYDRGQTRVVDRPDEA